MHWFREGARQRSKVLYVFRTPGGVRVGRSVLEPDVLRRIEAQYPDIQFDWPAVRENKQVIEAAPEPRRRRKTDAEGAAAPKNAAAPSTPSARAAEPRRPQIPSAIEGSTPDEQIAFLTTWYPVVRERIPERWPDPVRQEALLALAERLNPSAWTDADQITTGLQTAAEAFERLAHVFAKRRRRGRRRPAEAPQSVEDSGAADGATSDVDEPALSDT